MSHVTHVTPGGLLLTDDIAAASSPETHLWSSTHCAWAVNSESGIATHYVASHRLPALLERLNNLDKPTPEMINDALEEFHSERLSDEPRSTVAGSRRKAVDMTFSGSSVEDIMGALIELANQHGHPESGWAKETLETLELRSPTSLLVAFEALREGRQQTLGQALSTELGIATAYCVSSVSH